jgi:DNA-binding LacI/PurR family transcriptional regulator
MLLNELFEQEGKHVTFCFGRMNPPTIGHEQVFKTMAGQGGDFKIFVSQSQDKKDNPLDYATKIKFIKAIHSQYAENVVDNNSLNTIGKVASYLYEQGYRNATFVAGSDRLPTMSKLLKDYNGVEGKAHGYYEFDVLDFVSAGERDPDSDGVSGVSASKARAAAANNNLEEFKAATGAGEIAKEMFAAVRQGMGINES